MNLKVRSIPISRKSLNQKIATLLTFTYFTLLAMIILNR